MAIFREIPPTAGLPVFARDFLSALGKDSRQGSLEKDIKDYLGVEYARITYSGTSALYIILESLKEFSPKKTVVIPAFICPLVPLAIKRAGFNVEACDINGFNFDFDPVELERICSENNDILAIVVAHLAGFPLDYGRTRSIAEKYGVFIIEDCAQSLGAEYNGSKAGTLGDFSFFSFCRGKGLTLYEGGAIVSNRRDVSDVIDQKADFFLKKDHFSEAVKIIELFGYWIMYRPAFFWFVFKLPQIFWKLKGDKFRAYIEYFDINFSMHEVSGFRKAVGHAGFSRIQNSIIEQREKARYYENELNGVEGVSLIKEAPGSFASYPFVTVLFKDQAKRKKALAILEDSGLGVSFIYAAAINGYAYLREMIPQREFSRSRDAALRHITLSTNTYISRKEMDLCIKIIKNLDNL